MTDERDRDRPGAEQDPEQDPEGWNWSSGAGEQRQGDWPGWGDQPAEPTQRQEPPAGGWGDQPAEPTQRQEPPAGGWAVPGSGGQGDQGGASAWGAPPPPAQDQPAWGAPPPPQQEQPAWAAPPPPPQDRYGTAWAPPGQGAPPPGQGAPPPGQGGWAPPPGSGSPQGQWPGAWPAPPGYPGGAPPRRSRAWLFVLIPVVLIVAGLAVVGLLNRADRDQSGEITEGGTVGVFDLAVGDCLQDPTGGEEEGSVTDVEAVPCSEPHDNEVYALFDVEGDDDAPYPGDEAVDSQADDGCLERFEDYVGTPYEQSEIFYSTIVPRSETWAQGDREVVCLAYIPDEELTGSVEGSER